ncbi:NAD(P)/FAD-dependent oxidoreductase [Bordetella sp. 2513F-2]
MPVQPKSVDVVIVGGGITGCATAYYLSKLKLSVALVERGTVANEQSSRAWGFIRKQGRHAAEIPLAARAAQMWPGLSAELGADLEFVSNGILTPALNEADEIRIADGARQAAHWGLSTKLLSAREVSELMPQLTGAWRGALYTPDDAHGEPKKVTQAYAAAAARAGVHLLEHVGVKSIEVSNGAVSGVETTQGFIAAKAVLCAAGVGSAALMKPFGLNLPIHGVRLTVLETQEVPAFTNIAVWAPNVSFRPTGRGTFYVGSGYRAKSGDLDVTVDAIRHFVKFLPQLRENPGALNIRMGWPLLKSLRGGVASDAQPEPAYNPRIAAYNLGQFRKVFPHLGEVQPKRIWAGRIDATPDMIPIIDRVPGVEGLHLAAGYSGHGFALGPVSGAMLADIIAKGGTDLDIHPFRISRFEDGDAKPSKHAL